MVARERPWSLGVLVLFSLSGGAAPALVAWSTSRVIDAAAEAVDAGGSAPGSIWIWLGVVAVVGAVLAVQSAIRVVIERDLDRTVALRVRGDLMTNVNALPDLGALETPSVHDHVLLARTYENAPASVVRQILAIGQQMVATTTIVLVLASISVSSAAVAALAILPAIRTELLLSRRRAAMLAATAHTVRRRQFFSDLVSDLRAAKEIRVYGLGELLVERMRGAYRAINVMERRFDTETVRAQLGLTLLTNTIMVLAMYLGMRDILGGAGTVGGIAVLLATIASVRTASTTVVNDAGILVGLIHGFDHHYVVRELARPGAPSRRTSVGRVDRAGGLDGRVAADGAPPTAATPPEIEFDDVWFRYTREQPWVLRGLSLRVSAGATVAIVGPNGAGKSTILKLICKLYTPDQGRVACHSNGFERTDGTAARRPIGVLFQDYMEYELSAAENIGLGNASRIHDDAGIRRAARKADVLDDLERLPDGLQTMLSRIFLLDREGEGTLLSGGQWQRLALARAYFADGGLLLLDEPTATLDADAEQRLACALAESSVARTSIVVSHRFSTARMADRIVVVEDGVVSEEGSHDELLARGGTYARMYNKQSAAYR